MNDSFVLSFTRENEKRIKDWNMKFEGYIEKKQNDIIFTPELVKKHTLNLKRNKSPRPDNLGWAFLLDTCGYIAEPFSIVSNLSLKMKQVPNDWKCASVTPIFKKGDKSDPGNSRPISLTSQVCKVLESILRDYIVNHLTNRTLLL